MQPLTITIPKNSPLFPYVDDIVKTAKSGELYKVDFDEMYSKFGIEMDYSLEEVGFFESEVYLLKSQVARNKDGVDEVVYHELMFTRCRAKKKYNFNHLGCRFWSRFIPVIVNPKYYPPSNVLEEGLLERMELANRNNDIEDAKKIQEEWGITHEQTEEGLMFHVNRDDYLNRLVQIEQSADRP